MSAGSIWGSKASELRESYLSDVPRIHGEAVEQVGVMATRESNVIKFPQPINPERKVDVRIAEQIP